MKMIKRYGLLTFTILLYVFVLIYDIKVFKAAIANTILYLKEMVQILPAVFILTSLLNAWVPREAVEVRLGKESGLIGRFTALFLGAVSAGPVYISFPLVQALLGKGMSVGNAVIIIGAWAAAKVPMFLIESRFLGIDFASARTALTVIAVLIMGALMDGLMEGRMVVPSEAQWMVKLEGIAHFLPNQNCQSCGYEGCLAYVKAAALGEAPADLCAVGGEALKERLSTLKNQS